MANKKWYIVHVYSGFESKVKVALEERVALSPHPEKFGEVTFIEEYFLFFNIV